MTTLLHLTFKMDEVAKYCKYCSNRIIGKDGRFLCGLTNNKPNFEDVCSDYSFNNNLRNEFSKNLFKNSNFELTVLDHFTDFFYSHFTVNDIFDLKILYSISKAKFLLIVTFIFPLVVLIDVNIDVLWQSPEILGSILLMLLATGLMSFVFWLFIKADIKKSKSGFVLFGSSPKGCVINNEVYEWNTVGGFHVHNELENKSRRTGYSLDIYIIGKKMPFMLQIESLNISRKDLQVLLIAIDNQFLK